jgi:hypothetical protein
MSKTTGASFKRRAPDNLTEELVAILSSKASFEFKPLFDLVLVNQGAVTRTVTGITKKYKGVASRMVGLKAEMKVLRAEWSQKLLTKAAARG